MIKIEHAEVHGIMPAIYGMRNPMNSWNKSDSYIDTDEYKSLNEKKWSEIPCDGVCIGYNDDRLAINLATASHSSHRKFLRMIDVWMNITAPLYWWKEFDTYKVGTVANSCSTMHKIHAKEFTLDDFSHEHLDILTIKTLYHVIDILNKYRELYVNYNPKDFEIEGCPSKKDIWWQMIQLLPSSYNQLRTVKLNYEVLRNIYESRKNHKLDEWVDFCKWIEKLPYNHFITLTADESYEAMNQIKKELNGMYGLRSNFYEEKETN